jgi:hypothetical protein
MGKQYLDIWWVLLIATMVFVPWLAYRLGIEVGRDQMRREISKRARRVRALADRQHYSNVTPIRNTK